MKTQSYNPSPLEVELSYALKELQSEIEKHLTHNEIIKVENKITEDNPILKFHLLDRDGDPHEIVVKVIQKPDSF